MTWDRDLQTGSFRGVSFSTLSITDAFARRVARHRYPYKDGAELEDVGGEARQVDAELIFRGDTYLADLLSFLKVCTQGATGALIHPLFGSMRAKCQSANVRHEQSRRNAASVAAVWVEDGVNTAVPTLVSIDAAAGALSLQSAAARATADDLSGDAATALPATSAALDDADVFAGSLDETIGELSTRLDQLGATINSALAEVDALATDAAGAVLDDVGRSLLRDDLRLTLERARTLKERTERLHPQIVPREIGVHVPLASLAAELYGDPDRADDLLRVNKIRDPFLVPPGMRLKVFAG